MNLTKLEKGIIVFLVVGAILAAGIFFFIVPAYNSIEDAKDNLSNMQSQQAEIEAKLAREATIDDEISDVKKEAEKFEESFYPDLTTYEAVELVLAYLKDCNLNTESISVTPLATRELSLSTFSEIPVSYDLKTYSETAHGVDENALASGEFFDNGKKYRVTVNSLTDIVIADAESGDTIDRARYTDTMKEAYKEALCATAAANEEIQTVGATSVTFSVTGKYEDYLKFIDYIFDLDRAAYMEAVTIPMTVEVKEDDNSFGVDEHGNVLSHTEAAQQNMVQKYEADMDIEEVEIELVFFSVNPMEQLENIDAAGVKVVVNQREEPLLGQSAEQ